MKTTIIIIIIMIIMIIMVIMIMIIMITTPTPPPGIWGCCVYITAGFVPLHLCASVASQILQEHQQQRAWCGRRRRIANFIPKNWGKLLRFETVVENLLWTSWKAREEMQVVRHWLETEQCGSSLPC